jgi:hypothetical protein
MQIVHGGGGMKFVVRRTSDDTDEKPCAEAYRQMVTYVNPMGKTETEALWVIDFEIVDDLMRFFYEYGDLVIRRGCWNGLPTVEIYDDYRE